MLTVTFNGRKVYDSSEEHPGEKFVKASAKFLHKHLHKSCGPAYLGYYGPPLTMNKACSAMTGMGYKPCAGSGNGATFSHPDADSTITVAPAGAGSAPAAAPTADRRVRRRARDVGEAGDVGSAPAVPDSNGSYGGGDFLGSIQRNESVGANMPERWEK